MSGCLRVSEGGSHVIFTWVGDIATMSTMVGLVVSAGRADAVIDGALTASVPLEMAETL